MPLFFNKKKQAEYQLKKGLCYHNGDGVEKDEVKAAQWYRKAAEQGNASAQYNLSVCYFNGKGVERDRAKSAEWYKKVNEQGKS